MAEKLHADAKEFVPSWLPKPASATASSAASFSDKALAGKNGATIAQSAAAKISVAGVVKQAATKAPAAKPASVEAEKGDKISSVLPKAPAPSAWGSKPSEAVKKAAPFMPQPLKQQRAPSEATKRAGLNRSNHKPEVQRQQQSHSGRGGKDGGRGDRVSGRQGSGRSVNKHEQVPDVERQDQLDAGRGGRDGGRGCEKQGRDRSVKMNEKGKGDAHPANIWVSLAAAEGGVKEDDVGQSCSQSKSRGGNASGAEQGSEKNIPPVTSWARAAAAKPSTSGVTAKPGTGGAAVKGGAKEDGSNRSQSQSAAKTGTGDAKDDGGHRRHSQSRGVNASRAGQGGDENNADWSRAKAVPLDLLRPGEGKSDAERAVTRIDVEDLLAMRLVNVAPPSSWECGNATKLPVACIWVSPTRVSDIEGAYNAPRIGGDVSERERSEQGGGRGKSSPNDTAPALEDCKPLEVNDETRWKAKVMEDSKEVRPEEFEGKDEILRKAMLILNKLSLTKFDKLSDEFINCGISRDIECLTGAVSLIVNYAQEQQHFSEMYARLCLKLAYTPMEVIDNECKKGKFFKKTLLERCQTEFMTDTSTKIKNATKEMTDAEEIEYNSNLIKKHYLGHMRFIGELYKCEMIGIKIMLWCLQALLVGDSETSSDDVDEEKIACFTKLMSVIGSSLELQSECMKADGKAEVAESLADCWRSVKKIARENKKKDGPKVSNRIKFMLQDLIELKENGWVTRRKEETAKTLDQIHKEVANEERAATRRGSSNGSIRGISQGSICRGASTGDVRVTDKGQEKPQVDEDGFVSVPAAKGRSLSVTALHRRQSDGHFKFTTRGSTVLSTPEEHPSNTNVSQKSTKKESTTAQAEKISPKFNYPSPDECGNKAKAILKEFFTGGDMNDAVLSIQEIVGVGNDKSLERGTEVVRSVVLMVLEMRQVDVDKFLGVFLRCAKEMKIESESFVLGLNDPLEFLSDIAIDAPLAISHLVNIVAELVKADIVPFDFLLNSPDYFRTDENAADFGAKVMKKIGNEAVSSEDYTEVIKKLMTVGDRGKYSSAIDLIAGASRGM